MIFDYKQRLEKSLKTEKAEHQQTKKDLENKLDEEKSRQEKATNEANLKMSSLQQQYNMLQASVSRNSILENEGHYFLSSHNLLLLSSSLLILHR